MSLKNNYSYISLHSHLRHLQEQFLEFSDLILPHCKEQKSQRFIKWKNEIKEMIKR